MGEISRGNLFSKLDSLAYKAIEGATVFCKLRGNPYVELVHWMTQLLENNASDIHAIVRHYALDAAALARDVTAALDRLPRGSTALSDFSEHIPDAIERAWVYGSLQFGDGAVRSAYLLLGMLKTPHLRNALLGISKEFGRIKVDDFADELASLVGKTGEQGLGPQDGSGLSGGQPGEASGAMAPAAMGKQEAIRKYTVDLTAKAEKGEMDPITGRDDEIRQIVDILMRRRQNNPILTGEAGVGKTAVVEGFAQRLSRGDVPLQLQGVSLLSLDLGLLQAGASMKGEFEQRLRQLIDEVQASPKPIILFIDEVHTLVGAGGAAGTGDAANLLKPALARGTLRTIGATTWAEYKKHIEKDPALTRRFQVVQVPEPTEEKAKAFERKIEAAEKDGSLKPGQTVEIKGPSRKLEYASNMKKEIGMIAGGTGLSTAFDMPTPNPRLLQYKLGGVEIGRSKRSVFTGRLHTWTPTKLQSVNSFTRALWILPKWSSTE
jgi:type VI secretion system protein VasG